MEIISHKGNMCYLVWNNAILSHGLWGGWLNSNRYLGEK